MKRINIIGTSCSGKSTFAKALAAKLSLPHVELDNLYFEADWVIVGPEVFRSKVSAAAAQACWVMDGNYLIARDHMAPGGHGHLARLPVLAGVLTVDSPDHTACLQGRAVLQRQSRIHPPGSNGSTAMPPPG